jgi:hypothetical protein
MLVAGCVTAAPRAAGPTSPPAAPITVISPRCGAADSCLMGLVLEAESAKAMPQAAVFLELEAADGKPSVRYITVTDDQGVFTVVNAAEGSYRLAVYKEERRAERTGVELGMPGTTVVPVLMPPS